MIHESRKSGTIVVSKKWIWFCHATLVLQSLPLLGSLERLAHANVIAHSS